MKLSALSDAFMEGEQLYSGWCSIGNGQMAEMVARSDFGAVIIDMQHGGIGFEQARQMASAVTMAGKPAILRIPVGDFAMASRALDFGALAIIAPMINGREDAQSLVNAVKFPPIGERSYGPMRACELLGIDNSADYVRDANMHCLAFAMVETMQALANLDDILAVDGIDGIFVGPADMSLTLLKGEMVDLDNEAANVIYRDVAARAKAAGKIAGIYSPTAYHAKRFAGYGYRLISVGADSAYLKTGISALWSELSA